MLSFLFGLNFWVILLRLDPTLILGKDFVLSDQIIELDQTFSLIWDFVRASRFKVFDMV